MGVTMERGLTMIIEKPFTSPKNSNPSLKDNAIITLDGGTNTNQTTNTIRKNTKNVPFPPSDKETDRPKTYLVSESRLDANTNITRPVIDSENNQSNSENKDGNNKKNRNNSKASGQKQTPKNEQNQKSTSSKVLAVQKTDGNLGINKTTKEIAPERKPILNASPYPVSGEQNSGKFTLKSQNTKHTPKPTKPTHAEATESTKTTTNESKGATVKRRQSYVIERKQNNKKLQSTIKSDDVVPVKLSTSKSSVASKPAKSQPLKIAVKENTEISNRKKQILANLNQKKNKINDSNTESKHNAQKLPIKPQKKSNDGAKQNKNLRNQQKLTASSTQSTVTNKSKGVIAGIKEKLSQKLNILTSSQVTGDKEKTQNIQHPCPKSTAKPSTGTSTSTSSTTLSKRTRKQPQGSTKPLAMSLDNLNESAIFIRKDKLRRTPVFDKPSYFDVSDIEPEADLKRLNNNGNKSDQNFTPEPHAKDIQSDGVTTALNEDMELESSNAFRRKDRVVRTPPINALGTDSCRAQIVDRGEINGLNPTTDRTNSYGTALSRISSAKLNNINDDYNNRSSSLTDQGYAYNDINRGEQLTLNDNALSIDNIAFKDENKSSFVERNGVNRTEMFYLGNATDESINRNASLPDDQTTRYQSYITAELERQNNTNETDQQKYDSQKYPGENNNSRQRSNVGAVAINNVTTRPRKQYLARQNYSLDNVYVQRQILVKDPYLQSPRDGYQSVETFDDGQTIQYRVPNDYGPYNYPVLNKYNYNWENIDHVETLGSIVRTRDGEVKILSSGMAVYTSSPRNILQKPYLHPTRRSRPGTANSNISVCSDSYVNTEKRRSPRLPKKLRHIFGSNESIHKTNKGLPNTTVITRKEASQGSLKENEPVSKESPRTENVTNNISGIAERLKDPITVNESMPSEKFSLNISDTPQFYREETPDKIKIVRSEDVLRSRNVKRHKIILSRRQSLGNRTKSATSNRQLISTYHNDHQDLPAADKETSSSSLNED